VAIELGDRETRVVREPPRCVTSRLAGPRPVTPKVVRPGVTHHLAQNPSGRGGGSKAAYLCLNVVPRLSVDLPAFVADLRIGPTIWNLIPTDLRRTFDDMVARVGQWHDEISCWPSGRSTAAGEAFGWLTTSRLWLGASLDDPYVGH
jgi:hypothetical protein